MPRFRLLRRAELVSEIEARRAPGELGRRRRAGARAAEREPEPEPQPESGPERRAGRGRSRSASASASSTAATEEVTGVLEITPQRYGFLRLNGLETNPDDVYISASQVRRCELRPGDEVSGPARAPRRGERHRALVHVDRVNGGEPLATDRSEFDDLTPILPKRRLAPRPRAVRRPHAGGRPAGTAGARPAGARHGGPALRPHDAPARPRAGGRGVEGPELIVLLIDERPEEATAWREALPDAEIATATADLAPAEQVRVAELALERARRRAEAGADVVLIVRLAVAARGRVGRRRRGQAPVRLRARPGRGGSGLADRDRHGGRRAPRTMARRSAR